MQDIISALETKIAEIQNSLNEYKGKGIELPFEISDSDDWESELNPEQARILADAREGFETHVRFQEKRIARLQDALNAVFMAQAL